MSDDQNRDKGDAKEDVETTGHVWDGIEELNNPLPRWWLWTFYATIIWGLAYTIAYPAWPLVNRATAGLLGYSTRAEVQADIDAVAAANAGMLAQLAAVELASLSENGELQTFAVNAGSAVFLNNCSQCHGRGANGAEASGYPSLIDDAWLWGGRIDEIAYSIRNGIRNEQSPDARWSQMPAYGEILSDDEIEQVVAHVLAISGQPNDAVQAEAGAEVYAQNCAACHGDAGLGLRALGAPNLTDAVWLYGGSPERIEETVRNSRFGVMPAWAEEYRPGQGLSDAEINAVAAYVYGLGGGEPNE